MNIGFDEINQAEFQTFLEWYGENVGTYAESDFDGKKQYKNKDLRRIAYYAIKDGRYMVAEDLFTHYYHSYYNK